MRELQRVHTAHGTTSKFDTSVGSHQGSVISPYPSIMSIDTVVMHLLQELLLTLLYPNGVVFIADLKAELHREKQMRVDAYRRRVEVEP